MFLRICFYILLSVPFTGYCLDLQPIPQLKSRRVIDQTNTLTEGQKMSITNELAALEKRKGSQVVVLVVPTTHPEEIEEYSIRVADTWKIGRGGQIDDGVILVVAMEDRKLRIEVGYGLEGAITDAYAKRIIEQVIKPEFKSGDYYHGIARGVQSIETLIDGEELPEPSHEISGKSNGISGLFILIPFIIFLVPLFGKIGGGKKKKGSLLGKALMFIIFFIIFWILFNFVIGIILSAVITLFSFASPGGGGRGGGGMYHGGGFGGGFSGGGGFGGGFSGGGGGFGGGGASGGW